MRSLGVLSALLLIGTSVVLAVPASAASYQVLHSFTGISNSDGDEPFAELAADQSGRLYGTTFLGGQHGGGSVFRLTKSGKSWTEEVLGALPEMFFQVRRLVLAGDEPSEIRAWVTRVVDDDHVRVEIAREPKAPNLSPPDTEMYKALVDTLTRRAPGVVVAPEILVAFTDSWVFRRMGLAAYGWSPFVLDDGEWRRVHGNDERISLENLREGARAYTELLLQIAGA